MYPLKVTYKNCLRRYDCAIIIGSYDIIYAYSKKKNISRIDCNKSHTLSDWYCFYNKN